VLERGRLGRACFVRVRVRVRIRIRIRVRVSMKARVRVRVVLERGRLLVDAQRAFNHPVRHEERRALRHRPNERRGEAVVERQDAALSHGLARRVERPAELGTAGLLEHLDRIERVLEDLAEEAGDHAREQVARAVLLHAAREPTLLRRGRLVCARHRGVQACSRAQAGPTRPPKAR